MGNPTLLESFIIVSIIYSNLEWVIKTAQTDKQNKRSDKLFQEGVILLDLLCGPQVSISAVTLRVAARFIVENSIPLLK